MVKQLCDVQISCPALGNMCVKALIGAGTTKGKTRVLRRAVEEPWWVEKTRTLDQWQPTLGFLVM